MDILSFFKETKDKFLDMVSPLSLYDWRKKQTELRIQEITGECDFIFRYYSIFDTDTIVDSYRRFCERCNFPISQEDLDQYRSEVDKAKTDLDTYVAKMYEDSMKDLADWQAKYFGSYQEKKEYNEEKGSLRQQESGYEEAQGFTQSRREAILTANPKNADGIDEALRNWENAHYITDEEDSLDSDYNPKVM